jgi:hypothetical protein
MYVGPGEFIEAPHTGAYVQYTSFPGPITGSYAVRP